jgi:hypothetical protein
MRRATSGTSASASGSGKHSVTEPPADPPKARGVLQKESRSGGRSLRKARALGALALALAAGAFCNTARADDVDACVSASEKGQDLRDQGHLRSARALFVTCAAERCPTVVQKDCAAWLSAVDAKLPSVSVHARDGTGRDLTDVRVLVDGETLATQLDGRAFDVDPGSHTFRFVTPGSPEATQTLVLREGEKSRPVDVTFGARPLPAENPATFSVPTASWVLGGLSVAAFGALAGFGYSAKSAVDEMRTTCAPDCAPERVDAARRDLIIANVGLSVGAAALGTAVLITIVHNTSPSPAPPPKSAARTWKLSAGGGGLALSGAW